MPYEQIQGEIMTMNVETDSGFSGVSTDYDGAQSQTFQVRWIYPGGISGRDWHGLNNNDEIDNIAASETSNQEKINNINGIVYAHIRELLTNDGWDAFNDEYGSTCVTIYM